MRRIAQLIPMLALCGLLAGCNEPETEDPMVQLRRENQALQQQCQSQDRMIFTMAGAVIMLGATLAVSLGVLLRKGGRPSATATPSGRTVAN